MSGTFTVWHTAINRIDLPFASTPAAETDGEMLFRLWRDPERTDLVAEIRLPLSVAGGNAPADALFFAGR